MALHPSKQEHTAKETARTVNDPQESSGKREELTQLRLCILLYERLEFATLAHVPMYQRRRNLQAGRKGAGRDLRVKY